MGGHPAFRDHSRTGLQRGTSSVREGVHGQQGGSREGLVDAGPDSVGSCAAPTLGRWAHRQRLPPLPPWELKTAAETRLPLRTSGRRSGGLGAGGACRRLGRGWKDVPAGGFQMGDTSRSRGRGSQVRVPVWSGLPSRPLAVVPHGRRGRGFVRPLCEGTALVLRGSPAPSHPPETLHLEAVTLGLLVSSGVHGVQTALPGPGGGGAPRAVPSRVRKCRRRAWA